jgi:hypothetical protein
MKSIRSLLLICIFQFLFLKASCQTDDTPGTLKNPSTGKTILYGGFIHQHENFFSKAFSYQGIETGLFFKHQFNFGLNFSTFVSPLHTGRKDVLSEVLMSKFVLSGGIIFSEYRLIHPGILLNAGYFQMKGYLGESGLFNQESPSVHLKGFIMAPQVYAEINALKWMKIRTGLDYNSYFKKESGIYSDVSLNGFSLSFSFLFGKFLIVT